MAYYIKSEKKVADKIGAPVDYRNRTADGKILLWQADLLMIPGDTILDKAAFIGGAALTPIQAKEEIDGTCGEPAPVSIPEFYADKVEQKPEETPLPGVTEPEGSGEQPVQPVQPETENPAPAEGKESVEHLI